MGGNGGSVSKSHSSVALSFIGFLNGGDLVGANSGTIDGSFADGDVPSGGGLVGLNQGLVVNSHASGKTHCGGLVCTNNGTIQNSYATGAVSGDQGGGLVGVSNGLISSSYATGSVTVDYENWAGGLVGLLQAPGIVRNSYSTGSVSGGQNDEGNGGLIGENFDNPESRCVIENSYAIGSVSGSGFYNGGVVGVDDGKPDNNDYNNVYWDLDTSGISNPSQGAGSFPNDPGIAGLSDTQLKSSLPAGFDPAVWGQNPNVNNGYPFLLALPPK